MKQEAPSSTSGGSSRENPNCYQYFSEKFRNDIDICKDAVQLGEIHDVIQYGPISEKDWKEVILEKLSEFEN